MKTAKPDPFIRTTISLPGNLRAFADTQAANDHAGNLSAFFRSILLPVYRKAKTSARNSRNHESQ